jgi:hypothetical protein
VVAVVVVRRRHRHSSGDAGQLDGSFGRTRKATYEVVRASRPSMPAPVAQTKMAVAVPSPAPAPVPSPPRHRALSPEGLRAVASPARPAVASASAAVSPAAPLGADDLVWDELITTTMTTTTGGEAAVASPPATARTPAPVGQMFQSPAGPAVGAQGRPPSGITFTPLRPAGGPLSACSCVHRSVVVGCFLTPCVVVVAGPFAESDFAYSAARAGRAPAFRVASIEVDDDDLDFAPRQSRA